MSRLILLRHGESEWNKRNLFTGWVDVPLSQKGIEEAIAAGLMIQNFPIDIIFTSSLIRAQMTALLAMSVHSSKKVPVILHENEGKFEKSSKIHSEKAIHETIPVIRSANLNERAYGDLQGLNKAETAKKFGAEQVQIWRRSYSNAPPHGESLEMTAARSIPYFKTYILPELDMGKHVFVCAHGNSLRSIMMHLDELTIDQVVHLELATGAPVCYEYSKGMLLKCTSP